MGLPDPNIIHAHGEATQASGTSDKYKQIFSSRAVQLMAFFVWVYVGVEVTIGGKSTESKHAVSLNQAPPGWIVTYIIEIRNGGPSSGYISSGFFGGAYIVTFKKEYSLTPS